MTYSLARFAVYENVKTSFGEIPLPFYQKILLSAGSGAFGGLIGQPADLVNVRMQNDMKLAADQRRNYKHAFDGLIRITREEGFLTLFNGVTMCVVRAALVTIGQLGFYDQAKQVLMAKFNAPDNVQVSKTTMYIQINTECLDTSTCFIPSCISRNNNMPTRGRDENTNDECSTRTI